MVSEQELNHSFKVNVYVNMTIGFSKCYKRKKNGRNTAPLIGAHVLSTG